MEVTRKTVAHDPFRHRETRSTGSPSSRSNFRPPEIVPTRRHPDNEKSHRCCRLHRIVPHRNDCAHRQAARTTARRVLRFATEMPFAGHQRAIATVSHPLRQRRRAINQIAFVARLARVPRRDRLGPHTQADLVVIRARHEHRPRRGAHRRDVEASVVRRMPRSATRSRFGVSISPPNARRSDQPRSSATMSRMLGRMEFIDTRLLCYRS